MRLELAQAIEITPLTLPEVEAALADIPKAAGVLPVLRDDSLLRELLTTPLMLNITLLAYAGQSVPDVQARTVEERRAALFGAYARRMLQRCAMDSGACWSSGWAAGWPSGCYSGSTAGWARSSSTTSCASCWPAMACSPGTR